MTLGKLGWMGVGKKDEEEDGMGGWGECEDGGEWWGLDGCGLGGRRGGNGGRDSW